MPQFIVLSSYNDYSYEQSATCTGRTLPIAEVRQYGLNFAGRTSYANYAELEDGILAAGWLYVWYEVEPGDTICLEEHDWDQDVVRERVVVTVPEKGLLHPPSSLEEFHSCDQLRFYGLVSRNESTTLESVTWKIGGLMMGSRLSADECVALMQWLPHFTEIDAKFIAVDGDKLSVTFRHDIPLTAYDALSRRLLMALKQVNKRWYPARVRAAE